MSDEPPKSVLDISIATPEEEEEFLRREAEEREAGVSRLKLQQTSRVQVGLTSPEHGHKDLDRRMWDARESSMGSPSFHNHLESGHQKPGHSVRKG